MSKLEETRPGSPIDNTCGTVFPHLDIYFPFLDYIVNCLILGIQSLYKFIFHLDTFKVLNRIIIFYCVGPMDVTICCQHFFGKFLEP